MFTKFGKGRLNSDGDRRARLYGGGKLFAIFDIIARLYLGNCIRYQMTWFGPWMVLLKVRTMSDIIWGKCAPKNSKGGVNRHFQAKLILKFTYLCCGSIDFDEIWHTDAVPHFWPFRPLKIWNFKNSTWRRPPSWKIERSPYLGRGWSDFDKIWHSDAVPPAWPFWPLKNWNFKNPSWNLVCELIRIGV